MRKMFPVLKKNEGGVEIIAHLRDADTNYRGKEKMFFLPKNDRLFILSFYGEIACLRNEKEGDNKNRRKKIMSIFEEEEGKEWNQEKELERDEHHQRSVFSNMAKIVIIITIFSNNDPRELNSHTQCFHADSNPEVQTVCVEKNQRFLEPFVLKDFKRYRKH